MKCTIVQCVGGWEGQRAESCCCHFWSRATLCATIKSAIMESTPVEMQCSRLHLSSLRRRLKAKMVVASGAAVLT